MEQASKEEAFQKDIDEIYKLVETGVLGPELCPERYYWHWPVLKPDLLPERFRKDYDEQLGEIRW